MAAKEESFVLQSGSAGANGSWKYAGDLDVPYSIDFKGADANNKFQIMISNDAANPGDANDGRSFGAEVVAAGYLKVDAPFTWIKAKRTAGNAAASATLQAFKRIS